MSDVKLILGDHRFAQGMPGRHGSGDSGLTIRSVDDLALAKPLIQKSFEGN